MKILVVRQPWAWLIVHGYKDVENRSWRTHYRGALLIQSAASQPSELRVEYAPLDRMRADLLELEIPPGSQLNGVHLDELRLPVGAVVTMVTRHGTAFVPDRHTRLKAGDSLLIVASADVRAETEDRLAAVSRDGLLARWLPKDRKRRR